MNYNSQIGRNVTGVVRYSCDAFFFLFSFAFLYFLQGDLLSAAQYVLSDGLTSYSVLVGALVIPLILLVLKWLVALVMPQSIRFYALAYFPSFLILALLTDVDREMLLRGSFGMATLVELAVFLVLFVLVVAGASVLDKRMDGGTKATLFSYLWPNYAVMLAMFIFCGSYQKCGETLHYELKAERLIVEGDFEGALKVADREYVASRHLTELRMYALARRNELTSRLFDYPQLYGGDGLLSVADTVSYYHCTPIDVCLWLGGYPDFKTVRTTKGYLKAMNQIDSLRSQRTMDYELCFELLNRDINGFAEKLQRYYPADSTLLPKNFAEAVLYINNVDSGRISRSYLIPDEVRNQYDAFLARKAEITDPVARVNYLRREFGKTFWVYML